MFGTPHSRRSVENIKGSFSSSAQPSHVEASTSMVLAEVALSGEELFSEFKEGATELEWTGRDMRMLISTQQMDLWTSSRIGLFYQ
jgi:hypothetical protein